MLENSRQFEVKDPFGRAWNVEFRWLQNGISIRHADTVDLKYYITSEEEKREVVIALPHEELTRLAAVRGRAVTDAWCLHLASRRLEAMIAAWADMEQAIVTVGAREMGALAATDEAERQARQREAALHH
jgi:hypothetical protein